MELEHPHFGKLVRDGEYEWCESTLSFPALALCRILFSVWWDGEIYEEDSQREPSELVQITVFNGTDCTPSPAQNAACLFLQQNQNEIAAAALAALDALSRKNIEDVRKGLDDAEQLSQFNASIVQNELDTLAGVMKQVELTAIGFLEEEKNGHAYISMDFNCGWDDEHGVSLLMHKNEVLAISGCADFYHRGEGLEAHAEILRNLTRP